MNDDLEGSQILALEGKEARLFLRQAGPIDVLGMYTREATLSSAALGSWQRVLDYRHRWFTQHGIPIFTLFVPEACAVYEDMLPTDIRLLASTPFDRLRRGLTNEVLKQVIYLRQILIDGRGERDTYEQVDSHWTHWGAYLAYQALMRLVQQSVPKVRVLNPLEVSWKQKRSFGDLGVTLTPERSCLVPAAFLANKAFETCENLTTERRMSIVTDHNRDSTLPIALIFRDSFSAAMAPFLSSSFSQTTYVSSRTVFYDLVRRLKPDVVIFESAERGIFDALTEPDVWDARALFDDLRLGAESAMVAQRRSRSLLGTGKLAEALAASDLALEEALPGASGRARALAHRSEIYRKLANVDAALECLRHALTLESDGALLAMKAGELEQGRGRMREAIDHFRRAAALEPDVPFYWEVLAQALLLNNSPQDARDSLDRALAIDSHRAGSHLLLADAMCALGDFRGAERHAVRAVDIDGPNLYTLSCLVSVLIRGGDWAAAHATLERGLDLFPENADFLRYRVLCADQMGGQGCAPDGGPPPQSGSAAAQG